MIRKLLEKLTFSQKVMLVRFIMLVVTMMLVGILGNEIPGAEFPH